MQRGDRRVCRRPRSKDNQVEAVFPDQRGQRRRGLEALDAELAKVALEHPHLAVRADEARPQRAKIIGPVKLHPASRGRGRCRDVRQPQLPALDLHIRRPREGPGIVVLQLAARPARTAPTPSRRGPAPVCPQKGRRPPARGRGQPLRPRTRTQKTYVKAIQEKEMVFGIGPAGTGKTFLAVACAVAALERGLVSRIVLTRPVVEAGEKLGFLPGDFYEKVHPYLKPLYDAFHSMVGADRFRTLRDEEVIEIVPLAYMRGRTLDEAFAILDEAQNTTPEQMKMFLTRMGNGSRMVITGDVTQIDLETKARSGLVLIQEVLRDIPEIPFVRFTDVDVVRHPLVQRVLKAYDAWGERGKEKHD